MRCYLRTLNFTYKDHVTNEDVRNKIRDAISKHDDLFSTVKKHELRRYDHIPRASGMTKTILQGTVKGTRRRVRQRKMRGDNIKDGAGQEFGEFVRAVKDRVRWRRIVETLSMMPYDIILSLVL